MDTRKVLVIIVAAVMLISGSSVLMAFSHESNNQNPDKMSQSNRITELGHGTRLAIQTQHSGSLHQQARKALNNTLSLIKSGSINQTSAYVPNYNNFPSISNNQITPTYSSYPAPMGIGDFGLKNGASGIIPYNLTSSEFIGTLTINSSQEFYPGSQPSDSYSIQLNAVLNNVTLNGNSSYVYWTQDVALYTPSTNSIQFIDNIWNFSGPNIGSGALVNGNGTNAYYYYYDETAALTISAPFTVKLYLSTATIDGNTEVSFSYKLLSTGGTTQSTYDQVQFNSTAGTPVGYNAPNAHFLISGNHLTPMGTLNDAELIIGGPGGGSTASFYSFNGNMSLQYYTTNAKTVNVPSAYDFGGDTGETSEGLAFAWTGANAVLNSGPSFLYGMWNVSTATTMQSFSGSIYPSNSMFFVSQGASFKPQNASWVPLPASGNYAFILPSGTYTANVSLSDFDPYTFPLSSGVVTSLIQNLFMGLYTPIEMISNSQLSGFSSGSGTPSSHYLLFNGTMHNLNSMYARTNDYGYPLFFGLMLAHITDYTDINGIGLFNVQLGSNEIGFNLSLTDILQSTSHVSLWGATYNNSLFLDGVPNLNEADITLVNSTGDLVGDNYFNYSYFNSGISVLGGSGNYIWGNHLISLTDFYTSGVSLDSGGNTIYNNYFYGMANPAFTGYNSSYTYVGNTWNIAEQSSTNINTFNGYILTGSIIGTSYQGGNYWWNYNGVTPFNDFYGISNGLGDSAPLVAPNLVTFKEYGLPQYTGPDFSINGVQVYGNWELQTAVLNLLNGNYHYTFENISGSFGGASYGYQATSIYVPSSPSGNLTLNGQTEVVNSIYSTQYLAYFTQTGLANSQTWKVQLSNGQTYYSNSSSLSVYLRNGTYSWESSSASSSESYSGTFEIAGNPILEELYFSSTVQSTYLVVIENGLPLNTPWSFDTSSSSYVSTTNSINISDKAGQLNFTVPEVSGFKAIPSTGTWDLNPGSNTLYITFEAPSTQNYGYISGTFNAFTGNYSKGAELNATGTAPTQTSALDPNTGLVWIAAESNFISVLNDSSHSLAGKIKLQANQVAIDVAYNSFTGYMYATSTNYETGQYYLTIISPSSMSIIKTTSLPVGDLGTFIGSDNITGTIYVISIDNGNITYLNGETGGILGYLNIGNVTGGGFPAFDWKNQLLYIPASNGIYSINTANNQVTQVVNTTNVEMPFNLAIDYKNNLMYSLGELGNLSVYNMNNFAPIAMNHIGNGVYLGLSIDTGNGLAYAVQFETNRYFGNNGNVVANISVVNSNAQVLANIPVIAGSENILYLSQSNSFVLPGLIDTYLVSSTSTEPNLKITVLPADAVVTLNGQKISITDGFFEESLKQGWYYVNATESGYSSYSNYIFLSDGQSYALNITLNKLSDFGYLSGIVNPGDAVVVANGVAIPVIGGSFDQGMAPGTYYVTIMDSGYNTVVETVNITQGHTTYMNVSLVSNSNEVHLYGFVLPYKASLLVNGFISYVNETGYYSIYVPKGTYTISVVESGYFPYSENLTLTSSKEIDFNLTKEPKATSVLNIKNTSASGYGVTIYNVSKNSGYFSLNYSSSSNGTLLISVPISALGNVTLSQILNSTVYINGIPYHNFTVSISSNYEITLKVYGLSSGDPTIYWKYSPSAILPVNSQSPQPQTFNYLYAIIGVALVAVILIGVVVARRKR